LQGIGSRFGISGSRFLESLSVDGVNKAGQLEFTMKVRYDMNSHAGNKKGTVTEIFTLPASEIDFDALAELLQRKTTSPFELSNSTPWL
jgi:hypothetical protein